MKLIGMSAITIKDPRDPLPPDDAGSPETDKFEVVPDHAADAAVRKVRTKRPRPAFEDGSLTRVFKFPSKTYPRSSYYVTGTEIVIRIKKARKKWKLVIPKKRIVSYRTNRWFTKPRWVEIELTYTQATRLQLVAPRAAAKDAAGTAIQADEASVAAEIANSQALIDDDRALPGETLECVESDSEAADEAVFELDPDVDEPEHLESTASESAESDVAVHAADEPERGVEQEVEAETQPDSATTCPPAIKPGLDVEATAPAASANAGSIAVPLPPPLIVLPEPIAQSIPLTRSDRFESPSTPTVAARPGSGRPRRKFIAQALMTLTFVLLASTVARMTPGDFSETLFADGPVCGPATECPQAIVTGSIVNADQPAVPEPAPQMASAPAATAQPEPNPTPTNAPQPPGLAVEPAGLQEDLPFAAAPAVNQTEQAPQDNTSIDGDRAPDEPSATDAAGPPRREAIVSEACPGLAAAAQAISIQYAYASASLEHAALSSLDEFAVRLRSCGSVTVIIEGHTDSDGDLDRNHGLSFRRAQAVWEHLVKAGTPTERLSFIGYGHSRSHVPNDTAENKRRNRRAVLVVEPHR